MEFQSLGEPERKLLLTALEFDLKNLRCQYCKDKLTIIGSGIMPSVKTKLLATLVCNSPLCLATYLEDAGDD